MTLVNTSAGFLDYYFSMLMSLMKTDSLYIFYFIFFNKEKITLEATRRNPLRIYYCLAG